MNETRDYISREAAGDYQQQGAVQSRCKGEAFRIYEDVIELCNTEDAGEEYKSLMGRYDILKHRAVCREIFL